MGDSERLEEHILSLSEATNFNAARKEWVLEGIELSEELDNCPCGSDEEARAMLESEIETANNRLAIATDSEKRDCLRNYVKLLKDRRDEIYSGTKLKPTSPEEMKKIFGDLEKVAESSD